MGSGEGGAVWHPVLRSETHGEDHIAASVLGNFDCHAMFDEPSIPDVFRIYTCHKHFILTHCFKIYDDPENSTKVGQFQDVRRSPTMFLRNRMVLYSKQGLKSLLATETWFSRPIEGAEDTRRTSSPPSTSHHQEKIEQEEHHQLSSIVPIVSSSEEGVGTSSSTSSSPEDRRNYGGRKEGQARAAGDEEQFQLSIVPNANDNSFLQ